MINLFKKTTKFIKTEPLASLIIIMIALYFYIVPIAFFFNNTNISPLYRQGLIMGYSIAMLIIIMFTGFWHIIYAKIIIPYINHEKYGKLSQFFGDKSMQWAKDPKRRAVLIVLKNNVNTHMSASELEREVAKHQKMSHALFHYYILKELRASGIITQDKPRSPYYITPKTLTVIGIVDELNQKE